MEYNTSFSTSFAEQTFQPDPAQNDQQTSYFPTLWPDTTPIEFNLEPSEVPIAPMPPQTGTDSVTCYSYTHSPSESSSDTSRRGSQELPQGGKRDRRRAQNRAAQRAYRERKEQVRQELEVQVKEWQDKHQALRESYVGQAQEVQQLKQHIESLQLQLSAVQDTNLPDNSNLCDFDAWTGLDWKMP